MGSGLIEGFVGALSFTNLAYCLLGCLLGTVVGVLPGLGPAATSAILLPLTSYMPPAGAIIMLAGIYYGAMYGGSTTSILVNVPGEASSVPTCLDGFQMTKQGRAGEALAIAAIGSFIAGTFGTLALSFLGPALARIGLRFGPPEYFCLVVFSLTALVSFSEGSLVKGLTTGIAGLFLACIGLDPMSGKQRLTFGIVEFAGGLDVIAVLMGLFGVAEVLASAGEGVLHLYKGRLGHLLPRGRELTRGILGSTQGTITGFLLGLLPGMIPAVTAFIAYDVQKRLSKNPERFGTGCIEGVAAPEAANNATSQAGFIPLMSLGIPTSPTLAIMLAALMMYGLQPGPFLFIQHHAFAWTVIASMYIGNVILLILNLPLVGLWARLCLIPYRYLGPVILAVCLVGAFSVRNSLFDVGTCTLFGILGYAMKKRHWPSTPLILGVILGPMLEQSLTQSLELSGGSLTILFTRPIALTLLVLTCVLLFLARKVLRSPKLAHAG
ncbi:MAG TPA: tripartite tricarboxylate transporter permease [Candidatus Sulfotelmatobacter sp.]|nr:tripartite tricarboxylate transporter permease [Candidatus Sulfotelmatobacter sp.]